MCIEAKRNLQPGVSQKVSSRVERQKIKSIIRKSIFCKFNCGKASSLSI